MAGLGISRWEGWEVRRLRGEVGGMEMVTFAGMNAEAEGWRCWRDG